jgi:endonuclease/exonuclease/phosphatase (EEP) superfamily protein YafD
MFKNCVFKVSVDTQKWMKAAAVRAVKTMAQVAGSMLVIGAFNDTAWSLLIQTSLVAGLASVLTSITGIPEVKDGE